MEPGDRGGGPGSGDVGGVGWVGLPVSLGHLYRPFLVKVGIQLKPAIGVFADISYVGAEKDVLAVSGAILKPAIVSLVQVVSGASRRP